MIQASQVVFASSRPISLSTNTCVGQHSTYSHCVLLFISRASIHDSGVTLRKHIPLLHSVSLKSITSQFIMAGNGSELQFQCQLWWNLLIFCVFCSVFGRWSSEFFNNHTWAFGYRRQSACVWSPLPRGTVWTTGRCSLLLPACWDTKALHNKPAHGCLYTGTRLLLEWGRVGVASRLSQGGTATSHCPNKASGLPLQDNKQRCCQVLYVGCNLSIFMNPTSGCR